MRTLKSVPRLAIGLLLGLGIVSCSLGSPSEGRSATAGQPNAAITLWGRGVLQFAACEDIRCPADQPRTVLSIAEPGRTVKKGDLLVEFDASTLLEKCEDQEILAMKAAAELSVAELSLSSDKQVADDAVAVAERSLHMAETQLKNYRTAEYPSQETAAKNEAILAEERATRRKMQLDELEAAYKEQPSNSLQQELMEIRLASTQARMEMTAAQDKLKLLKDTIFPRRTEELELAVAQRQLDLLRARNEATRIAREGEMRIAIATAMQRMEKERSLRLRKQMEACTLCAPRDGAIVSPNAASSDALKQPEIQPGDTARPNQVLLRLADPAQLKLDVHMSLPTPPSIAVGRPATIRCNVFPDRTFRGHVTGVRVLTYSNRGVNPIGVLVTVRLDDPANDLKPGMEAAAELDASSAL